MYMNNYLSFVFVNTKFIKKKGAKETSSAPKPETTYNRPITPKGDPKQQEKK